MFAWYALGWEWQWIAGSQSESMFCDFSGIVNEGFTIPGLYFCEKYVFGRVI